MPRSCLGCAHRMEREDDPHARCALRFKTDVEGVRHYASCAVMVFDEELCGENRRYYTSIPGFYGENVTPLFGPRK